MSSFIYATNPRMTGRSSQNASLNLEKLSRRSRVGIAYDPISETFVLVDRGRVLERLTELAEVEPDTAKAYILGEGASYVYGSIERLG